MAQVSVILPPGVQVMVGDLCVQLEQYTPVSGSPDVIKIIERSVPGHLTPFVGAASPAPVHSETTRVTELEERVLSLERRLFSMADQVHGMRGVLGMWSRG